MLTPKPDMLETITPSAMEIAGQRYEILFQDGTAIGLHQVWQHGAPVRLLRALRTASTLIVFDLSDLVSELDHDLAMANPRDIPGLVFYSLRGKFKTADEALAIINTKRKCTLTTTGQVPHAMAEAA
jgi:hypothetical protein